MWEDPAYCGRCHSWAGSPGLYKKAAQQAVRSKAVSTPPCIRSCLSFCFEFLPLHPWIATISWDKPSVLWVAFGYVVHHSNRNFSKIVKFVEIWLTLRGKGNAILQSKWLRSWNAQAGRWLLEGTHLSTWGSSLVWSPFLCVSVGVVLGKSCRDELLLPSRGTWGEKDEFAL